VRVNLRRCTLQIGLRWKVSVSAATRDVFSHPRLRVPRTCPCITFLTSAAPPSQGCRQRETTSGALRITVAICWCSIPRECLCGSTFRPSEHPVVDSRFCWYNAFLTRCPQCPTVCTTTEYCPTSELTRFVFTFQSFLYFIRQVLAGAFFSWPCRIGSDVFFTLPSAGFSEPTII